MLQLKKNEMTEMQIAQMAEAVYAKLNQDGPEVELLVQNQRVAVFEEMVFL